MDIRDLMNPPQDSAVPKLPPRRFLVRLGVGVLILNLFVILMAVFSLRRGWHGHQDRAAATAQNLAQVLDRYVADTLSKADLALWAVKDEAERAGVSADDRHDLDAFIRRQLERAPGLLALRTADAQGVTDHGSGPESSPRVSVADRDYFTRLRDVPGGGLVISKPVVGRVLGQWIIVLARRLERPDHGFAGVVFATITLDQFEKVFSSLDVGQHGSLAIRDLDLGLVTRYPEAVSSGTAVGQQVISPEFKAFAQSGRTEGIYQATTPFDHIKRIFAIRKVSGQPFYLLVGLAEQDYLSGWWLEVLRELMGVGFFICLTLVASWLIRRAWLRQQAVQENLERLLAEVKTLGGMLPICSHCKKIRDDKGYWNQIESYLNEHIDAEFTHGICPECAKDIFPLSSGKHTAL